uniref:Uncharacterized protein n=1 Tax=Anopheles coluzzii TaxID=1518534 RepID=A0A8W7Q0M5_ANOCL
MLVVFCMPVCPELWDIIIIIIGGLPCPPVVCRLWISLSCSCSGSKSIAGGGGGKSSLACREWHVVDGGLGMRRLSERARITHVLCFMRANVIGASIAARALLAAAWHSTSAVSRSCASSSRRDFSSSWSASMHSFSQSPDSTTESGIFTAAPAADSSSPAALGPAPPPPPLGWCFDGKESNWAAPCVPSPAAPAELLARVGLAGTLPPTWRLPTRYRYGLSSVVEEEEEAELRSPLQLPESRRRG